MVDGLYEATEPDTAGACGRAILCGSAFPVFQLVLIVVAFAAGFIACRLLAERLREQRVRQKYERLKRACVDAMDLVGKGLHQDGFQRLIGTIHRELPAISRSLTSPELPTGAKTTLDAWKAYFSDDGSTMPIGSALAEIFSATEVLPNEGSEDPSTWTAPDVLAIRMHTLGKCPTAVDEEKLYLKFEAVEPTYPVLRPGEISPIVHTPAVIPPQRIFARDNRRFLRLVGQTSTMITVNLDGVPQLEEAERAVVCSCGAGPTFTPFVPCKTGASTALSPVEFQRRPSAKQNEWIRSVILEFQKAWVATPKPRSTPDGLRFLILLSRMFD